MVVAVKPCTLKIPVTLEDESQPGLWLMGVFRQVTRSLVLSEGPFKHTSKSNLSTACPGENHRDLEKTAHSAHRSIAKSQIKSSLGGGQAPAFLPLNPSFSPQMLATQAGNQGMNKLILRQQIWDTGQGRHPGSLAGHGDPTPGPPAPHSLEPVKTTVCMMEGPVSQKTRRGQRTT